ncbi:MAG: hypothetical protein ACREVG_05820 [Burkholderiales bacterium]
MRGIRVAIVLFTLISVPARAGVADAEDWALFSRVLALVQPIVHLAARSPDPQAAQKAIDGMLAGRNEEANRIASGLFDGMLADVPPEHRPVLRSIGGDLLVLARREQARAAFSQAESTERAIQARKELHAMGLRYWDEQQFQDAVKRGDSIAIELYLAARGLRNPPEGR